MGMMKRLLPSPAMVVAITALVMALAGVAIAAIPGPDGVIHVCYAKQDFVKRLASPVAQTTQVITPAGTVRVVDADTACTAGEQDLAFNQSGAPAGAAAGPSIFAMSLNKDIALGAKAKSILEETLPASDYVISGDIRLDVVKTLVRDLLVRCWVTGSDGKTIPSSIVTQTLSADHPGLEATVPIHAFIKAMPAGTLTLKCSDRLAVPARAQARAAGLIDGSLSSVHVADHSNVLAAMVGSQLTDASNNNANSKGSGKNNNAPGP